MTLNNSTIGTSQSLGKSRGFFVSKINIRAVRIYVDIIREGRIVRLKINKT